MVLKLHAYQLSESTEVGEEIILALSIKLEGTGLTLPSTVSEEAVKSRDESYAFLEEQIEKTSAILL